MIGRRHKQISQRDAVALADGSLRPDRRTRVKRTVASSPELAASLAAQRRALDAIRENGLHSAPAGLRARLELARAPTQSRRAPRCRVVLGGGLAAAALSAIVVLVIGVGSSAAPSVASASTLGGRVPTASLVSTTADHGTLAGVSAAGISFPDWAARFGFKAAGVRRDRFDGRLATTVFYGRGGERIAYTIVSGAPLSAGAAAKQSVWGGTRLASLSVRGRVVVTWRRDGHSCVLSATRTPATTLALLAETSIY